jgi:hypothetical protein
MYQRMAVFLCAASLLAGCGAQSWSATSPSSFEVTSSFIVDAPSQPQFLNRDFADAHSVSPSPGNWSGEVSGGGAITFVVNDALIESLEFRIALARVREAV